MQREKSLINSIILMKNGFGFKSHKAQQFYGLDHF